MAEHPQRQPRMWPAWRLGSDSLPPKHAIASSQLHCLMTGGNRQASAHLIPRLLMQQGAVTMRYVSPHCPQLLCMQCAPNYGTGLKVLVWFCSVQTDTLFRCATRCFCRQQLTGQQAQTVSSRLCPRPSGPVKGINTATGMQPQHGP